MGAGETLREVAVDLAERLASAEAQAWADLGPERAWEHRAEALRLYTGRIEAAMRGEGAVRCRDCAHMHENPLLDLPICEFLGAPVPDADGSCTWGERREEVGGHGHE